jgi:hypothetical protein
VPWLQLKEKRVNKFLKTPNQKKKKKNKKKKKTKKEEKKRKNRVRRCNK